MSYSLALGPFHPAWRGPQRFVIKLHGERISDVEYHHDYNARGSAERLLRLDLPQALHLVARICGTCSFAHSLAFCMAIENLCDISVAERAATLRSATAEIERIIANTLAAARILASLGMEQQAAILTTFGEQGQQAAALLTGTVVIPETCIPGGLRRDLIQADREQLLTILARLNRTLYREIDRLIDHRPLLARTIEVGALPRTAAEQFSVRGPLARASGLLRDTRLDQPYAGYPQLPVRAIIQEGGDVYARLVVLLLEAYESVKLAEQAIRELPDGPWEGAIPDLRPGKGSGAVEGPRGMIRYTIESDGRRLTRVGIDAPRQLDRLLARTLLSGALIDNAVVIIASTDHCTACAEL